MEYSPSPPTVSSAKLRAIWYGFPKRPALASRAVLQKLPDA
jgi:hypothetical protein